MCDPIDRPPLSLVSGDRGAPSIAQTAQAIDVLQSEVDYWRRKYHAMAEQFKGLREYAERDLARLNSELSQCIHQRDIARNQRDDARAQLFGMSP